MMRISILVVLSATCYGTVMATSTPNLSPIEQLGKALFFDANLSTPPGQSCASCHAPGVGYTGPDSAVNAHGSVYQGAVRNRFGNRKPPTAAYAGGSPILHYEEEDKVWVGGMFWDGRATGLTLSDPLAEQAMGPYLNPLEQNNPSPKQVCDKVSRSNYAKLFKAVWPDVDLRKDVAGVYECIARSIAAYERSPEVSPFTSKYDYYLKDELGLSEEELWGLELFNGKAKCAACHSSQGPKPLFTDFTYDNLGFPKNPENPFYNISDEWNPEGSQFVDPGLGGFLKAAGYSEEIYRTEMGKHKVPTLRNVAKAPAPGFVKAFGHNGYFKSLEEIVRFYNTRDVGIWPAPEVPENVNGDELGNLGLTSAEEAAIVAFMKALSDGYQPE